MNSDEKFEHETLNELKKIYSSPDERVEKYKTVSKWISTASVILLLSIAYLKDISYGIFVSVFIAFVSGLIYGMALNFRSSEKQTPFLIKYTKPDLESIDQRINELESRDS
ncbi:MAG: hypothetical protein ACYTFY_21690 [Planctomycetota bacterium]